MTAPQIVIFAILAAMLALFAWDRLRYDVVALLALLAAVLTGIIPPDKAFAGFSNEVVPLIAGALVVSTAIGNSGLVDSLVRRLSPYLTSPDLQVGVLVALVTALSAFMKNIGALAIFLPVAFQLAQRGHRSASEFLMPLSFGSLVGGLATLMAVAVGAGSDFLSPIGHQCNTLVLGPGGYRFADYWRLGLPACR